ncbi:hypothetical protein [Saccharopolyspora shandongensis]|uniref:hypothetical protein n=1 Tax=Saccharopolyspora shandongensis TaxID=418495 RepID=UPI0034083C3A
MAEGDDFAADIEALRKGGVDLSRLAELARSIHSDLSLQCVNLVIGGSDDISKELKSKYKPGEKDGLEFLRMLGMSLDSDGEAVVDTSKVFDNANTDATDGVKSHGRK